MKIIIYLFKIILRTKHLLILNIILKIDARAEY